MVDDIYVYLVDLPGNTREAVLPCDGGYTVYIDKKLPDHKVREAFDHAVGHVIHGDWQKDSVQKIEEAAHERSEDSLSISKVLVRIPD